MSLAYFQILKKCLMMKISTQSNKDFNLPAFYYIRSIFVELIFDDDLSKTELIKKVNEFVEKTLGPAEVILAAKFNFEYEKYNKSIVTLYGDLFKFPVALVEQSNFKDSIYE